MSGILNPYAQAGWGTNSTSVIPSVQGALPSTNFAGGEAKWVTFHFSSSPAPGDVSNCIVTDPDRRPRFTIQTTMTHGLRTTVMRDESGGAVARIEWHAPVPVVELRTVINHLPRQTTTQFLVAEGGVRRMVVRGKTYQWTRLPQEGVIRWSNISYNPAEQLGALYKTPNGVFLAVAPSAISQGLLDIAILASVVFSCGA